MITKTLLIGPRGQITIPKKIRDIFKSKSVKIELLDNEHAIISPVRNVGGSLSKYKRKTDLTFEEIRNESWTKEMEKKYK